jgi:hypothetical protein
MEVLADDELAFHSKLRVCPKRYLFNQNQPTVLLVQSSYLKSKIGRDVLLYGAAS